MVGDSSEVSDVVVSISVVLVAALVADVEAASVEVKVTSEPFTERM